MSERSPAETPPIPPMPDIGDTENLTVWMKTYIIRSPKGYDDLTHPDGTPFNQGEQIDAFIQQATDVIESLTRINRPASAYEPIKQAIVALTQPEEFTLKDK